MDVGDQSSDHEFDHEVLYDGEVSVDDGSESISDGDVFRHDETSSKRTRVSKVSMLSEADKMEHRKILVARRTAGQKARRQRMREEKDASKDGKQSRTSKKSTLSSEELAELELGQRNKDILWKQENRRQELKSKLIKDGWFEKDFVSEGAAEADQQGNVSIIRHERRELIRASETIRMACDYVKEEMDIELTKSDDIVKGELNVPLTVLVIAVGCPLSAGLKQRTVGVMTSDGKALSVCVERSDWDDKWESTAPGMVISFDGNVCCSPSRMIITAISSPAQIGNRFTFDFKELPDSDAMQCAIFGIVEDAGVPVYGSDNYLSEIKVKCSTPSGNSFILRSHYQHHITQMKFMHPGTLLYIAPASFMIYQDLDSMKSAKTSLSKLVTCYPTTAIFDAGNPNFKPVFVRRIEDLRNVSLGSTVKLSGVLVNSIVGCSVNLINEPGVYLEERQTNYPSEKYRVFFDEIPKIMNVSFEMGNVADVIGTLRTSFNGILHIKYLSMSKNKLYKDELFEVGDWHDYELLRMHNK